MNIDNPARRCRLAAFTACGLSLHIACALLSCPNYASAQSEAQWFDRVGLEPEVGAQVPLDLEFVDADGQPVRLSELFADRPVILHLIYYECPMLCKLSSDGLLRSLNTLSLKLGEDYEIITVSFDPREGPRLSAKARDLAMERCGREAVAAGWTFLTGNQTEIDRLCKAVGFRYFWDERRKQFAHASGAFVLTSDGKLSRYLSGIEFPARDLRLALVEASEGKVGTAADQVLLLCYMYDPITGRYGLAIITAVRIAGIATVLALSLAIFVMLRRERRASTDADAAKNPAAEDYLRNPWSFLEPGQSPHD